VLRAAASALNGYDRVVLAVSGGLDSMVLLDAVAATFRGSRSGLLVATFDHRTGPAASRAVKAVQRRCASIGLECVTGLASATRSREHEWREERWKFLRASADNFKAPVVTAHTLDDQIETVFMRILRDAGPRGLAGLFAESDVVRPFLGLRRKDLAAYAEENRIRHIDDPSNGSRAHLRNRVRHDLLPAMTRVRPGFSEQLLTIAGLSAAWRVEMAAAIEAIPATISGDGSLRVARSDLAGYDADSLRCLWPALAAKVGVVMDRRGTQRLAEFTMNGHTGGSIQLSGGIEVRMFRDHLLLARWDAHRVEMIRNARLETRWAGQSHRPELS
jgi:tRNA(Ile)-lysidine synthase